MKGILIAGTNSGCGKTTITLGIIALLRSLGKNVAPFKVGPDYIDPGFHKKVSGNASFNLDSFMCSDEVIKSLFIHHSSQKDIAVVEGVMGFYDGMGQHAVGSTYDIAKLLNLPVILIIDCSGLYQSVAAIVKGYTELKPDAHIAGIFLNRVYNEQQYQFMKEVVESATNVPCIGYMPTNSAITFEERHLGLVQEHGEESFNKKIHKLIDVLSQTLDINKLIEISYTFALQSDSEKYLTSFNNTDLSNLTIGVAHDAAFSFYYEDNIELLKQRGARITYFSPVSDYEIPHECSALYFGGGYPEVYAKELEKNTSMRKSVLHACIQGMPVYAECGGLMYLTNSIKRVDGTQYTMCGFFNCTSQMTNKLQRFGYAVLKAKGRECRTHEFHCSELIENNEEKNYTYIFELSNPEKKRNWKCGLQRNNVIAGYAHVHFYSDKAFTNMLFNHLKNKELC